MNISDRTAEHDRLAVLDNAERGRYELHLDDEIVGFASYSLHDGVVTVPHVQTTPEHRGKDFAARLMSGTLADLRDRSLKIQPLCSYADVYMRRHPETADLRA